MKSCIRIVLLVFGLFLISFSPSNFIANDLKKIMIDIGHGGKDPGALGATKSFEKDIAFQIATQLGSILQVHMPDVQYFYTRYNDDFVPVAERARMANKQGVDFFMSIHTNASTNPSIKGTETYVMGLSVSQENMETAMRENQAIKYENPRRRKEYPDFASDEDIAFILTRIRQNNTHLKSIRAAELIEKYSQQRAINRQSLGVKSASFLVLYKSLMPSVLVETGYITNSEEEKYLQSEEGIHEVASYLYRALRDYKAEIKK
ncbi:MAG: N-acetylmuramoyl-L-alanine amidase [Cytophagales bacterium]|nr:N-acetylmuramoyl-L-alanine amidase [Bernardetiaceae bacterium]MDW8206078.1 N-acetylmuramoyl-L-alanine amidase [Cytophagales bacterium]